MSRAESISEKKIYSEQEISSQLVPEYHGHVSAWMILPIFLVDDVILIYLEPGGATHLPVKTNLLMMFKKFH